MQSPADQKAWRNLEVSEVHKPSLYGPPKPAFLEVVMVVNLVIFRWPKPLFFIVLGARGRDTHGEQISHHLPPPVVRLKTSRSREKDHGGKV